MEPVGEYESVLSICRRGRGPAGRVPGRGQALLLPRHHPDHSALEQSASLGLGFLRYTMTNDVPLWAIRLMGSRPALLYFLPTSNLGLTKASLIM